MSYDGRLFRDPQLSFETGPVPKSWARVELEEAKLAFRDADRAASILVNARCRTRDEDTPLPALVSHLLMGTTERTFELEETIPFDGREARHVRLTARLDGVANRFEVYVLKKDGCIYDLLLVAPPHRFGDSQPSFSAFVRGFRGLGRRE